MKDSEDYRLLPSQVAQQTLISVDEAFKSFLGLLKAKKEGKVEERVSMPKYLPQDGVYQIVFPKDQFKTEGKKVRLSLGRSFAKEFGVRYLYFDLPATVLGKKIKEVRIMPRVGGRWFEIEYVYKDKQQLNIFDLSRYLGVDLGLDNFAAVVDTIGTAFLIDGRFLKSVNRWYNKERARLQSIYSKQGIKMWQKTCSDFSQKAAYN